MKNLFIDKCKIVYPQSTIITEKNSLACGVVVHKKNKISKRIQKKYWLHTQVPSKYIGKMDNSLLYTFFFLPHLKRKTITNFFKDVKHHKNAK